MGNISISLLTNISHPSHKFKIIFFAKRSFNTVIIHLHPDNCISYYIFLETFLSLPFRICSAIKHSWWCCFPMSTSSFVECKMSSNHVITDSSGALPIYDSSFAIIGREPILSSGGSFILHIRHRTSNSFSSILVQIWATFLFCSFDLRFILSSCFSSV